MPIHDWTRIPAGLFHHFHQDWSIEIVRDLNRGRLPRGVVRVVEQRSATVRDRCFDHREHPQSQTIGFRPRQRRGAGGAAGREDRSPEQQGD